jgi:integrase
MGIRQIRGLWHIDYYRGCERVRELVGDGKSKTLAAQALHKFKLETAEERLFPNRPRGGDLTVADIMARYWEGHLQYRKSARYSYAYREAVKAFGHYRLIELTPDDLIKYQRATIGRLRVSRRKDGKPAHSYMGQLLTVKPWTANRVIQALSAGINYAIKRELVRGYKNPCALVPKVAENNIRNVTLTEEQFNALYRCVAGYLKPVVLFAYYTGCRKSEILKLKKADVDFFQNVVFIRDTKNNEPRYVPIASELKETLLGLVKAHPENPYVFTQANGSPILDLKKAWYSGLKRAGLQGFRFHDLRHVAISRWAANGNSHLTIMQVSGHKTMSAFKRYVAFKLADIRKVVESRQIEGTKETRQIANAV